MKVARYIQIESKIRAIIKYENRFRWCSEAPSRLAKNGRGGTLL